MLKVIRLTERDDEILQALCLRVRYFSQRQLCHHWFDGDAANTRRRMKQLKAVGMVTATSVTARSIPPLTEPLIAWQPSLAEPEYGKVAHACSSRWRRRYARACKVYLATKSASQRYGGRMPGEVKRELHATHDLGVSQVWLQLAVTMPHIADAWCGEDMMAHTRKGQKLPDGFIVDAAGEVRCVIEFGGAYDEKRVREFHEDCAARALPYQLW